MINKFKDKFANRIYSFNGDDSAGLNFSGITHFFGAKKLSLNRSMKKVIDIDQVEDECEIVSANRPRKKRKSEHVECQEIVVINDEEVDKKPTLQPTNHLVCLLCFDFLLY